MLFSNSTFVLRAENRCICCGSDLEPRIDLRNGMYFEVLADSLETYSENAHFLYKAARSAAQDICTAKDSDTRGLDSD